MRPVPVALALALSAASVALVVAKARRDSADPARCGVLLASGSRCCAPGQREVSGRCEGEPASCPGDLERTAGGCVAPAGRAYVQGGLLHAGLGDWEAHGRIEPHDAVVGAFELDRIEATERDWAACVAQGACAAVPMRGEPGLPVSGVTREQAGRLCAWRGGRLPTDDEWTWAAGGPRSRRYPWGDTGAVCRRGTWGTADGPCALGARGAELAGSHPDGASPEHVQDLAGNVAEWVTTRDPAAGAVRGGSWADALATDLRTWQRRAVSPDARSPEIGVRCAYDISPTGGAARVIP